MWCSIFCTLFLLFFDIQLFFCLAIFLPPLETCSFEGISNWGRRSLKQSFLKAFLPCLRNNFCVICSTFALRKFHSETHSINSLKPHFFLMNTSFIMMHEGCLAPPKQEPLYIAGCGGSAFWARSLLEDQSAPFCSKILGLCMCLSLTANNPFLSGVLSWHYAGCVR